MTTKSTTTKTTKPSGELGNLVPINVLRTENVFSQLPIHQLAKSGQVRIRIIKRHPKTGQIDFRWQVSPSEDWGHPRQLAYKLDKLIVDRRIDELRYAGSSIPRVFKLGSLNSILKQLGQDGTRDTNKLKNALRQNATVSITARIEYVDLNGKKEWIEDTFSRYGIRFKGAKLPDGTSAETAYLLLNDPYYQIVNHTKTRPLDYDYLLQLESHPAAFRFYDYMAPKFHGAIAQGRGEAWVKYSDYCTYACQKRNMERQPAQAQMSRILKPHRASGYIEKVRWEETTDVEGNADWVIYFKPGERATAQYETFTGKKFSPSVQQPRIERPRSKQHDAPPVEKAKPRVDLSPTEIDQVVNQFYLIAHNIESVEVEESDRLIARTILEKQASLEVALFTIEFVKRNWPDIATMSGLLTNNYLARAREAHGEQQQSAVRTESRLQEITFGQRYAAYRMAEVTTWTTANPDAWDQLVAEELATLNEQFPNPEMPPTSLRPGMAAKEARKKVAKKLTASGTILGMHEWERASGDSTAVAEAQRST